MASLLTLLTDFGTTDYYVGAVKGTLLRLAPEAVLIDLSHEVPAGDVEAGADLLAGAAPTFPEGTVHLAVVDPGVGSDRRILVVACGGQRFVGPDNGLLTPFLPIPDGNAGGATAWSVERADLFLECPGATFHGRDRFAPVAAALARGEAPETLGPEVADAVRLPVSAPHRDTFPGGETLTGRLVRVDRFGNLVTDVPAAWLDDALAHAGEDGSAQVELAGHRATRRVSHYAELPAGVPGFLPGSRGTVEVSLRGESLAERWRLGRGTPVRIVVQGR